MPTPKLSTVLTMQPDYKLNTECHTFDGSPKSTHGSLMPLATLNLAILGLQILYTHQPTKKHSKPSFTLSPSTSQIPEVTDLQFHLHRDHTTAPLFSNATQLHRPGSPAQNSTDRDGIQRGTRLLKAAEPRPGFLMLSFNILSL